MKDIEQPIVGGCLCGAVRYEISEIPAMIANCHCRVCQKATGSSYYTLAWVNRLALSITGSVEEFGVKVDSGFTTTRKFCPTCGSLIVAHGTLNPDGCAVSVASMDNPEQMVPEMDLWVSSAQAWTVMNPEIPKLDGNPEV